MALIALSVATLQVLSMDDPVNCGEMFRQHHNDEDSISISAPKRDACAFVTRTNLGHSGSIGIYTRRILFLMCWWGVAFVRRKNYGSRFQKRFARLAGPATTALSKTTRMEPLNAEGYTTILG